MNLLCLIGWSDIAAGEMTSTDLIYCGGLTGDV